MAVTRQLQFYLDRAAEARAAAEEATLDNVRQRCLRAEDAWNKMAERIARTKEMRSGKDG